MMTIQDIKQELVSLAMELDREYPEISPVEYLKAHFMTISEAILYADKHGIKLTTNPVIQMHNLCKSGKIESVPIGEKNIRLIVKDSFDKWIAQQRQKQGNG